MPAGWWAQTIEGMHVAASHPGSPVPAVATGSASGGRPRLLLHLGTHKTGTTALQFFLQQQRETLRKQGILYPMVGGDDLAHLSLQKAVGRANRQGDTHSLKTYLRQLQQLIDETAPSLVVLSSEHFFAMPQEWVKTLLHAVEPLFAAVTVVLYVRPQRELWTAIYNQKAKALKVLPSHALWGTTDYLGVNRVSNMFYADYLDCFARLIGREHVIVRPYRRSLFPEGDIVHDFCSLLGAHPPVRDSRPAEPINPSLGWKGLAFALQLAPQHFNRDSRQPVAQAMRLGFLRATRAGLSNWIGPAPNYLDAEEQRRVDHAYAVNNARLLAEYPSASTAFPRDSALPVTREQFADIAPEELTAVTAFIQEALEGCA